jgi:iron complex outermembrane recepter protein
VTAQRREQRLQDVPISITALTGAQLVNRGVTDTSQIGNIAPGVQITAYGASPTITSINIRGVAQLDYADHQESPNAVYLDGAYDVDRLEVLRGPQGTLFGRNATGGVVQIISRKPTDEFGGYLQGTYGSYNQARLEGAVGGALADNLSARGSFLFNRQDGYVRNSLGADGGADKTINGRFQLRWKPTSLIDNNLEIFGSRTFKVGGGVYDTVPGGPDPDNNGLTTASSGAIFENNCAALGYGVPPAGSNNCLGYTKPDDGPFRVDAPDNGHFRRAIWGITNTLVWDFGGATLTSISNYSHIRKFYQEDSDSSPLTIATYGSGQVAYQASQELRLNGASGPFRWTVGGYYLHIFGNYSVDLDFSDSFGFTAGSRYSQKVDTYAVFGQAEYDLTDKLTMVGGLRWTRDNRYFSVTAICGLDAATCIASNLAPTGAVTSGSDNRSDWSGKAQLTYKLSPQALLYAGVTRGNKGSLIQAPSVVGLNTPFSALVVKPEVLTSYEGGIKATLFDRRLTANFGGFYYDYHNFQAFNFVNLTGAIFNAEARNYGAELEVNADLRDGLSANISLAYLHTRVLDVSLPDGSKADQQSVFSPKYTASASMRKEFTLILGILAL